MDKKEFREFKNKLVKLFEQFARRGNNAADKKQTPPFVCGDDGQVPRVSTAQ
ncbi:MAG: hypothetical protein WC835_00760 [Candidatus Paceibacterota bacterium]